MLRAMGDRVVVRRVQETKSAGGLYVPETAKSEASCGEVLDVGPGKLLESGVLSACQAKVGDKVWFRSATGTEIIVGGERFHILSAIDVLVVDEPEPKENQEKEG